ncbi:polyamine aminopropyltransferase [Chondromyces crocatus]|uniref:S-adenosylmethionine decarboxylase proenzyme n=1 Tax=Chondromyces crocatus TaxID=52 RepID=A0A0K1ELM7_CHOCO|nr:polyamine aminopropyltransferase [Chondromyces crocatus]AKT41562.1 spermidine synthase [Chondromyces crocatus]
MDVLGRNIVAELFGCPAELLNDVSLIETRMLEAAEAAHATVISSTFHHFSPFGVSGVVVIQESHLAIHTWPEYGYAALDIFTCGREVDPWVCYQHLLTALNAERGSAIEQGRGLRSQLATQLTPGALDDAEAPPQHLRPPPTPREPMRNVWFTERDPEIALSLRHSGDVLHRARSQHQKIEVYETYAYGRMLTLDGRVMTTEGDEYVFNEMMAHVPLLSHPDARHALVIGGGDGGVARELLRHEQLDRVELVEIDAQVIDTSRRYLGKLSSALDHPKLDLRVGDGVAYVRACAPATFDVVCIDVMDPLGPSHGPFDADFYRDVARILRPGGVLVTQSASPRFDIGVFQQIHACLRGLFGPDRTFPYLIATPTYPSGTWSLTYCALGPRDPRRDFDRARARRFTEAHDLQYYSDEVHTAAFALPGYVKRLLAGARRPSAPRSDMASSLDREPGSERKA